MKNIVEVNQLTKKYGSITAVNNVSFTIEEGKFFSLLGPSGCGKTTILRIIGGFIEQDSGAVFIDGTDMKAVPPNKRNTSMVFQNLALFPHMNVEENIIYGLKKRKFQEDRIKKLLKNILSVVNLERFEKRNISQLSGGQQQRVALARSLIIEPKILLLDEPLASLDKKLRISMRTELKEIQRKTGTTFLYVTHDQSEALTMSDTVAVMNEGKIIQIGEPDKIYNRPNNIFVADFIGAGNFIPIDKIEIEKQCFKITTSFGGNIILQKNSSEIAEMQDYDNATVTNTFGSTADNTADNTAVNNNLEKRKDFIFFIRPEKIKISAESACRVPDAKAVTNQFNGRIISKTFEGPDIRIKIYSEELGNLNVEIKNDEIYKDFRENSEISFCWNIKDGIILSTILNISG
jgi:ABC-type Fe3+/spermidine/putrescine transport system ATPase subunit